MIAAPSGANAGYAEVLREGKEVQRSAPGGSSWPLWDALRRLVVLGFDPERHFVLKGIQSLAVEADRAHHDVGIRGFAGRQFRCIRLGVLGQHGVGERFNRPLEPVPVIPALPGRGPPTDEGGGRDARGSPAPRPVDDEATPAAPDFDPTAFNLEVKRVLEADLTGRGRWLPA